MILVFGGTTEGKQAIEVLEALQLQYIYSSKTEINVELGEYGLYRSGAFSVESLAQFISDKNITAIIHASHPFAEELHRTIEEVAEKSYAQFLQDNLFDKIGMTNSTVYDKSTSFENKESVVGYVNWRRKAGNSYLNGVVGDKGVYSTVEDMNKFSMALFENSFFSNNEIETAYQLWNKELYDHDNYGYGLRINMLSDSSKIVYHTGWWKGFRTYFVRSLNDKKTIVVLSNNSRTGKISMGKLLDLFDIKRK